MKRLNFGCGKKIFKDFVNADIQKGSGIDKSFDFNKFPYPLNSNEFDYVIADNVIEHLEDVSKVLDELHRISKNGAKILIKTPYYHCKAAYGDLAHKHFFTDDTFDLLVNPEKHYYVAKHQKKFEIEKIVFVPTRFGKIFPGFIRKQMSFILGEVYSQIEVTLKVIK